MRNVTLLLSSSILLFSIAGCGASQSRSTSASEELQTAGVSGREAPMLVMQFPNLARDWPAMSSLIPEDSEMSPLRGAPLELLLPGMAGRGLGESIDLSKRSEVGVFSKSLDDNEESAMILAIPLHSAKDALSAAENEFILTPSQGGATRLTPRPELSASLFEDKPVCEIWGNRQGVLTCGSIAAYTPGRGAVMAERIVGSSTVETTDTAVFEFPSALFQKAIEEDNQKKSQSRAELMGEEILGGFLGDLRVGRFGLSLTGQEPRFGLELEFASRNSVLTSTVLDTEAPMTPDSVFFRLPKDSDFAAQFSGMPRGHRKADVHALFEKIMNMAADDTEFDAEGAAPMTESVSKLFLTGGPSIIATGMDENAYREALSTFLQKEKVTGNDVVALKQSSHSWTLFGLKEPAEEWMAEFQKMHEIDAKYSNISAADSPASARPDSAKPGAPRAKRQKVDPIPGKASRSVTWATQAPAGAPKGSTHYITERVINPDFVDVLDESGLPPAATTTHLLLAGAGDYTWICMSSDLQLCVSHLNALQKGGENTMESHPLRGQLAQSSGNIVGLTSITGFMSLFLQDNSAEDLREAFQRLLKLRVQPGAARMAVPLVGSTSPVENGAGKLRLAATFGAPEILVITSMMMGD